MLVVFLQIVHILDGLWLNVDGEDVLVQTVVHALQHRVVLGLFRLHGEVFLYTLDAAETHVLRDFHGIGRPRGHHFATGADVIACQRLVLQQLGIAIEPAQFLYFLFVQWVIGLSGNHTLLGSLEKENHIFYTLIYIFWVQSYLKISKTLQLSTTFCV